MTETKRDDSIHNGCYVVGMGVHWKSHGVFTLVIHDVPWSIEVGRSILERKAGRSLADAEMDPAAKAMSEELRLAAVAKVKAAPGPHQWVQLELGDPHVDL